MADAQDDGQSGSGLRFPPVRHACAGAVVGAGGVALVAWLWTPTFSVAGSGVWAAIVFALGLYASILAHELAHGLTARGSATASGASPCGSSAGSPSMSGPG